MCFDVGEYASGRVYVSHPVLQTTLMQLVAMTAALNPAAIISAATGMVIRARECCCFGLL